MMQMKKTMGALGYYGMTALQKHRVLRAAEESKCSVVRLRDQSEAQRARDSRKKKAWVLEDNIEARGRYDMMGG